MSEILVRWTLEFDAVYCDTKGDHYSRIIKSCVTSPETHRAITMCWIKALESANAAMPSKDAVLISMELIDSTVENVRY